MHKRTYKANLGLHTKVVYTFNVFQGDMLSLLSTTPKPQRIYSDRLVGMVLLSSPEVSLNNSRAREYLHQCNTSTEYHFDDVLTQIKDIKQKEDPFQCGDVLITRHSNLGTVQVIFHLIITKRNGTRVRLHLY